MKIKIVGIGCQGAEGIITAYNEIEKALKSAGKLKGTDREDDFEAMISYTTNCYLAGNCLVENTLMLGSFHKIKIAGKPDDVDKMLRERPELLATYGITDCKSYKVDEVNLNDFDSISDLERAVS